VGEYKDALDTATSPKRGEVETKGQAAEDMRDLEMRGTR